jgi:hypothetical protein
MCDDFEDDYDESESMEENSFEDEYDANTEMDDSFAVDSECDNEPDQAEPQKDDFTAKDAFILGGAMGWAYEEGLRERKRRKRKRFSDDSD